MHSRTRDLAEVCRRADVLVVAAGLPGIVAADEGAAIAGLITPVPGGVGPTTFAMVLAGALTAATARQGMGN